MWKVVPLCERQLRDVNRCDILEGGLYRKCDIYKGGVGYDRFSDIYRRRNHITDREFNNQFVVQLYRCPLNCPYCYVTREGIFGQYRSVSSSDMVGAFYRSGQDVFHLMGGAPALYMEDWVDLLSRIDGRYPFHSDFLCIEKSYDIEVLKELAAYHGTLYAVSIKGGTPQEFERNTGTRFDADLFWHNLGLLWDCGVPFYMTFTGMSQDSIESFKGDLRKRFPWCWEKMLLDSFSIDLIKYEALEG